MSHLGGMTVLLARIVRRVGVRAAPVDLQARLVAAGMPLGLSVADLMALKAAAAFAGLLVAFAIVAGPARRRRAALCACRGVPRARRPAGPPRPHARGTHEP
jgi:hypothetical protein